MIDKKEEGMKHLFKSISGFIILAIFITGCATASVQIEGYDFMNAKWGMSKEEVEDSNDITVVYVRGNDRVNLAVRFKSIK